MRVPEDLRLPLEELPDPLPVPLPRRVEGSVRPPSSKSYSHRYLNLALLLGRPLLVERPLWAEDIELFANALEALGVPLERAPDSLRLGKREPIAGDVAIDCGNAGTMFRFLTASLTTIAGRFVLDGTSRLRERPIAPLVEALRQLGARIDYLEREGYAPLAISGASLAGGRCSLDAGASSQYLSALLMAGLRAREPVHIQVRDLTSAPYVELTMTAMRALGLPLPVVAGEAYDVEPLADGLEPRRQVRVEADWSAAAYPAAAAALLGGPVLIAGVERDSAQGDRRFLDVLERMGARVAWHADGVEVRAGRRLMAADLDLGDLPDQVPTAAALAAFAEGTSRIENVGHLRVKESDRLRAMALGLRQLGFHCNEKRDGLVIDGRSSRQLGEAAPQPVVVETFADHRIAMAFTLIGLRRPGVLIAAPAVVGKSYRTFYRDLASLLVC